jgi:hypothetical protein
MLDLSKKTLPKEATLENLIEDLDTRGLLVLQVLLGQKAMELLALEKINTISLIKP